MPVGPGTDRDSWVYPGQAPGKAFVAHVTDPPGQSRDCSANPGSATQPGPGTWKTNHSH